MKKLFLVLTLNLFALILIANNDSIITQNVNINIALQDSILTLNDSLHNVMIRQHVLQEINEKILGGLSLSDYLTGFIFAFIGMFLRWYYKTRKSIKYNPETPNRFIFSYWIKDNLLPKLLSILSTLVVIFITLRFPTELISINFSFWYAFVVGLSLDYFVDKIKKIKPE